MISWEPLEAASNQSRVISWKPLETASNQSHAQTTTPPIFLQIVSNGWKPLEAAH